MFKLQGNNIAVIGENGPISLIHVCEDLLVQPWHDEVVPIRSVFLVLPTLASFRVTMLFFSQQKYIMFFDNNLLSWSGNLVFD